MREPVVDLSVCIRCEVCVAVCPEVFRFNAAGFIEVVPHRHYPVGGVDEAIRNCPVDCIAWQPG